MNPGHELQLSTVEELDAEPTPGAPHRSAREAILGLILLLGVLGWAGWEWWRQERMAESYRAAQQAAAERRWDEARALYDAASGYKDADARASEAARLVGERDHHYKAAVEKSKSAEWAAALQAAQEVRRIEPDYRNTQGLLDHAERHVYWDALLGAVALRAQADPPGLYYRGNDGWVWLEGSDRWSTVVSGFGPDSHILYDVPGEGWTPQRLAPTPSPELGLYVSGSPHLRGRRLKAVHIGPEHTPAGFATLDLDPATFVTYIWGERGVWGLSHLSGSRTQLVQVPQSVSSWAQAYQPFDRPQAGAVTLPGDTWRIMANAPDGERLLVAEVVERGAYDSIVRLHLAGGDGSGPRFVYSHVGGILSAQFSPDGRLALVSTFAAEGERGERHEMVLLDLQGGSPPQVVAEQLAPGHTSSGGALAGAFIDEGAYRGKVLNAQQPRRGYPGSLKLVDPARPSASIFSVPIEGWGLQFVSWIPDPQTGGVVVFVASPSGNSGLLARQAVRMGPGTPPTVFSLEHHGHELQAGFHLRAGALYFLAFSRLAGSFGVELYRLPLSDLGNYAVRPSQVFSSTLPALQLNEASLQPWSFGPGMFAYVQGEALRARTYDGATDVLLETGVRGLYSGSWYEIYRRYLR